MEEESEKKKNSFIKDIKKEKENTIKLINESGEELFQTIIEVINEIGILGDQDILYHPKKYKGITVENFLLLYNAMEKYHKKPIYNEEMFFEHAYYFYQYNEQVIELFTMSGQGTESMIALPNKKLLAKITPENIVNFKDFLEHYKKEQK